MIRPIAIATDGYLCKKNTLSIAVNGYICTSKVGPVKVIQDDGGNGKNKTTKQPTRPRIDWYDREDNDVILIIKLFLQCQN